MKLKLDENLSRHLKRILSALQHDLSTAEEEGLLSKPDSVVAAVAKSEGRVLLTLDLEFGNLTKYPPGEHPGIILFRPKSSGPLTVNKFIEEFFRQTEVESLRGCLVVVDPNRTRVRWPEEAAGTKTESG
jgi:predicted nuclease of predicted toxin-antitoxin system